MRIRLFKESHFPQAAGPRAEPSNHKRANPTFPFCLRAKPQNLLLMHTYTHALTTRMAKRPEPPSEMTFHRLSNTPTLNNRSAALNSTSLFLLQVFGRLPTCTNFYYTVSHTHTLHHFKLIYLIFFFWKPWPNNEYTRYMQLASHTLEVTSCSRVLTCDSYSSGNRNKWVYLSVLSSSAQDFKMITLILQFVPQRC